MTEPQLTVVTTRPLPKSFPTSAFEGLCSFRIATTDEDLRAAVQQAQVLYSWQVPDTVPAAAPDLRWIQLPSAGADHIRDRPVWDSDVIITSSAGIHTVPMTEHFFAMLLGLTRRIALIVRYQERHEWAHDWRGLQRLDELRGKTLGLAGWGKIGDGVAHLARAFGMRVIGTRWSLSVPRHVSGGVEAYSNPPWLEPEDLLPDIVYPSAQLYDMLDQSDVIAVILPLTDETRHIFNASAFAAMRRGTLFFNLGRGQVVDETALVDALRSGRLAGAGLDVFDQEPLPKQSPLWDMPNVIVSPHVGGVGPHTQERAAQLFAVNLSRYLEGQPLLNVVKRDEGY